MPIVDQMIPNERKGRLRTVGMSFEEFWKEFSADHDIWNMGLEDYNDLKRTAMEMYNDLKANGKL